MRNLPTGTVSFLFSDIEGSTELLQRLGDTAYGEVLTEHHRLMREAFEEEDGCEVGTQGDAFFVAFPRAWNAVSAAMSAQQAFAAHAWPEGVTVRVRMGLHTGEPTVDATGYVGLDVHRAARICSAAHGGQVLLSDRTHAMTLGALSDPVGFRDLGEHRLKDLARAEHIFQLVIPGLPADFPALKSLEVLTNNLPSLQLTSFIGREREMAEIEQLVSTGRLVTLMGPGGTGKTRLVLQVASRLLEQSPHGVWLAELAPVSDPALVPQVVATIFGVREMAGRTLLDTLVDYLRPRDLLLVLDNCEHVVRAAAQLAATLLRSCPRLRILATSREALGIGGEVSYRVAPLSRPDPRRRLSLEQLTQFEAARLFIERAVLSNPKFVATDANAHAVAQVCHRLDGIPLAIELAAARAKVLSVEQIAKRLDDRFRLLTGGGRAGLPHHQTLRAAVDWSHELLSEQERVLFRRLAVFAGGFTLESAETVCSRDVISVEDVLDLLARLSDKSLVVTEELIGDVRYRLLETIRHYSHERLAEAGEVDALRQRHMEWHLEVAEQAEPKLRGPEQITWLDRLEVDHDDLWAALEWSKEDDAREEMGARLAAALHRFWVLRGYLRQGREWLERPWARSATVAAPVRAKALYGAAVLAFHQGDYGPAAALSEDSLSLYRQLKDESGIALSLNALGIVKRNQGDYRGARALLEESLSLSRQSGDRWALAETLNTLGVTSRRQGDREAATALFQESLALWRSLGDKWGLAVSLGHLGVVARQRREYERARALHEESLAIRRELGDRVLVAADLSSLGVVARHLGDYDHARSLLEESLALSRELGDKLNVSATLCTLGLVVHRQGNHASAVPLLEESLAVSQERGDKLNIAAALCNMGFVAAEEGDHERAAALHRDSLALYRELGDRQGIAENLMGLARVAVAHGEAGHAAHLLGAAEAACGAGGDSWAPSDRKEFDRAVTAARAALTEQAFAAAWARGQAAPIDDLISEAIA